MSNFKKTVEALPPQDRRKKLEHVPLEDYSVYGQVTCDGHAPADATVYHPDDMGLDYGMTVTHPHAILQRKRKISEGRQERESMAELENRLRNELEDFLRPNKRARTDFARDSSAPVAHSHNYSEQLFNAQDWSPLPTSTPQPPAEARPRRSNTPIVISATPSPALPHAEPQMTAPPTMTEPSTICQASQVSANMSPANNPSNVRPHAMQTFVHKSPPVVNFGKAVTPLPLTPQGLRNGHASVAQTSKNTFVSSQMAGGHYQQRPGTPLSQQNAGRFPSRPQPQHSAQVDATASAMPRSNKELAKKSIDDLPKPGAKTGQPLSDTARQVVESIKSIAHVRREGINVPQRKDLRELCDFDHNGLLRATSALWDWRWDQQVCTEEYWNYLLYQPTRAPRVKRETSSVKQETSSNTASPAPKTPAQSVPVSPGHNPSATSASVSAMQHNRSFAAASQSPSAVNNARSNVDARLLDAANKSGGNRPASSASLIGAYPQIHRHTPDRAVATATSPIAIAGQRPTMSGQMGNLVPAASNRSALQSIGSPAVQHASASPSLPSNGYSQSRSAGTQASIPGSGVSSKAAGFYVTPGQYSMNRIPGSTTSPGQRNLNGLGYFERTGTQASPRANLAAPESYYTARTPGADGTAYLSPHTSSTVGRAPHESLNSSLVAPSRGSRLTGGFFTPNSNANGGLMRSPPSHTGVATPPINARSPSSSMSSGGGYVDAGSMHSPTRHSSVAAYGMSVGSPSRPISNGGGIVHTGSTHSPSRHTGIATAGANTTSLSKPVLNGAGNFVGAFQNVNGQPTSMNPPAEPVLQSQQQYGLQFPANSALSSAQIGPSSNNYVNRNWQLAELQMMANRMRASNSETRYGGAVPGTGWNAMAPQQASQAQQAGGGHWNIGTPSAGPYGWSS